MQHSPGFLKLVDEAKPRISEVTIDQAKERLAANPDAVLLDVREDNEWTAGHIANARHIGKGILERDLEAKYPDPNTEILMYCGGGFRSILTCTFATVRHRTRQTKGNGSRRATLSTPAPSRRQVA